MRSKIFLVVAAIIIFFLFAEIILQTSERKPRHSDLYSLTDDEILAYTFTPNYTAAQQRLDNGTVTLIRVIEQVNSLGMRDYERPKEKENGTFRIIALGDSAVRGYGSDFNESFVIKLENMLNNNSGRKFEVLSFAVDGYDSLQELRLLEKYGLEYKPDLLVIGYVINDPKVEAPFNGMVNYDEAIKREKEVIRYAGLPGYCSLKNSLRSSRVINQLMIGWQNIRYALNSHTDSYNIFSSYYNDYCNWGKVEYSFSRISAIAEENNFKVLLIIFPYMYIGDLHDMGEFYQTAEDEGKKNGFEVLNLVSPLEKEGFKRIKVDSYHFQGFANTIIANMIYEKLEEMDMK